MTSCNWSVWSQIPNKVKPTNTPYLCVLTSNQKSPSEPSEILDLWLWEQMCGSLATAWSWAKEMGAHRVQTQSTRKMNRPLNPRILFQSGFRAENGNTLAVFSRESVRVLTEWLRSRARREFRWRLRECFLNSSVEWACWGTVFSATVGSKRYQFGSIRKKKLSTF